jgi:hypothetical protein
VRQDDIGDHQVDLTLAIAGNLDSFQAICGGDHLVAVTDEDPFGYLEHGIFVLDDQDGLSLRRVAIGRRLQEGDGRLGGDRQHDAEGGAGAGLGVDLHVALVLGKDSVSGGQAEPGSCAFFLGREERLGYVLNYFR